MHTPSLNKTSSQLYISVHKTCTPAVLWVTMAFPHTRVAEENIFTTLVTAQKSTDYRTSCKLTFQRANTSQPVVVVSEVSCV